MTEQDLPDAELDVLACLWKHQELSVRQIREILAEYRPMTHAAASTLLKRLQEKGLVTRKKAPVGKAFLFRAAVSPQKTHRRIVSDLMKRVFGGSGLAMVSALYESNPPSPEEIEDLQTLVDKLREKPAKRKRRRKK